MAPRSNQAVVGYLDVLGFKALVQNDFDKAWRVYVSILQAVRIQKQDHRRRRDVAGTINRMLPGKPFRVGHVKIEVWSDSIVMTGREAKDVIRCAGDFQEKALHQGLMLRGGISEGRHQFIRAGMVVSRALVDAVELEQRAKDRPIVLVDHDLAKTEDASLRRDGDGSFFVYPFGRKPDLEACRTGLENAARRVSEIGDEKTRLSAERKAAWLQNYFEAEAPRLAAIGLQERVLEGMVQDYGKKAGMLR